MKKGHFVRFCKIRKYSVPRGFMKWIPSNCKEKSNGPKFVRGPNLAAWNLLCRKTKEKGGTESSDQVFEQKDSHWSWINDMQRTSTVKRGFLIIKHMTHWRIKMRIRLSFICFLISVSKFFLMVKQSFYIDQCHLLWNPSAHG